MPRQKQRRRKKGKKPMSKKGLHRGGSSPTKKATSKRKGNEYNSRVRNQRPALSKLPALEGKGASAKILQRKKATKRGGKVVGQSSCEVRHKKREISQTPRGQSIEFSPPTDPSGTIKKAAWEGRRWGCNLRLRNFEPESKSRRNATAPGVKKSHEKEGPARSR